MQHAELLYNLVIGLLCLIASVGLSSTTAVTALSRRRFDVLLLSLWVLSRLGLYWLVFFALGMNPTSDVAGFYYPEGRQAMLGRMIYRDFVSNYSPAFPYLLALILSVWNSAKAIVLASILMDGLGLAVWLSVARQLWSESECRRFALLYALGSLMILTTAVAGQNQTWAGLLLGLSLLLYLQNRVVLSAVVAGLPVVLVKFLPVLYAVGLLRWRSRPITTAIAVFFVPPIVFGALFLKGVDILQPVRLQGRLITSGNIPYLLSGIMRLDDGWKSEDLQALAALVLAMLAAYLFTRPEKLSAEQIVWELVILTLTCALVNKKFFPNYVVMVFAPMCAVAAMDVSSVGAAFRFGLFNIVAALEPSLWFRLLGATETGAQIWQVIPRLRDAGELWRLWAFLGVDLALLGFYAYYLLKAWRLFHSSLQAGPRAKPFGSAVS